MQKVWLAMAKYWFVLTLGVLFMLAIVGVALRYLIPTNPTTPPPALTQQGNPDNTNTEFLNLTFSGSAPAAPEKMWVAKVLSFGKTNSQELLNSLINAYDLQQSPYVDTMWIGKTHSLEYDLENNEYRLSTRLSLDNPAPHLIEPSTVSQLVSRANTEAKKIFPTIKLVSFPNKAQLLKGGLEFGPASQDDALYIGVPFGLSFYDTPVLLEYELDFPMVVYIDARGEVFRIVARPFSAEFEAKSQHFSLSVQEALQEIQRGNASIIESYSERTFTPKLDKVVRGEFTNATLEYRIDPNNNLLVPYYHFVGTLVNYDNDLFTADVITPAVRLDQ